MPLMGLDSLRAGSSMLSLTLQEPCVCGRGWVGRGQQQTCHTLCYGGSGCRVQVLVDLAYLGHVRQPPQTHDWLDEGQYVQVLLAC
jgi:hypothetical protein